MRRCILRRNGRDESRARSRVRSRRAGKRRRNSSVGRPPLSSRSGSRRPRERHRASHRKQRPRRRAASRPGASSSRSARSRASARERRPASKGRERRRSRRRSDRSSSNRCIKKKPRPKAGGAHFEGLPGSSLGPNGRYAIEAVLGQGAFGRVFRCRDLESDGVVAVKVSGGTRRGWRQAAKEEEVLRQLDGNDRRLCHDRMSQLLDCFEHGLHFCLVFAPLSLSLHDLLRQCGGKGLLFADVCAASAQLLEALDFLHANNLAHTDVKCGNVMLRHGEFDFVPHPRHPSPAEAPKLRRPCEAVLIDFGGVTAPGTESRSRVGARQVRAPEIMLNLAWDARADLWSLGCVLVNIYVGQRLFKVHDDLEHLAMIERLLDASIPPEMGLAVPNHIRAKGADFDPHGRLVWPPCGSEVRERIDQLPTLCSMVAPRHRPMFLDGLLAGMLEIQGSRRIDARAALRSPFFEHGIPLKE